VHAHALHFDLGTVKKWIQAGATAQRAKAKENHLTCWYAFCLEHNVDPYLRAWDDPVRVLQVFVEQYREGCLAPSKKAVQARTVEDVIRAVGGAYS
jgi:hypothetical protein